MASPKDRRTNSLFGNWVPTMLADGSTGWRQAVNDFGEYLWSQFERPESKRPNPGPSGPAYRAGPAVPQGRASRAELLPPDNPVPGAERNRVLPDGTVVVSAHRRPKQAPKGPAFEGLGTGYAPLHRVPTVVAEDRQFQSEMTRLAKKYNVPEDDMYRVMSFESGRSFDPAKINAAGSGATGLIQFMPTTARGLGTSVEELSKMSRVEQLRWVERYFDQNRLGRIKSPTIDDLYMTIYKPSAVGKGGDFIHAREGSKEYQQNRGLDVNQDGVLTTSEAVRRVKSHDMEAPPPRRKKR